MLLRVPKVIPDGEDVHLVPYEVHVYGGGNVLSRMPASSSPQRQVRMWPAEVQEQVEVSSVYANLEEAVAAHRDACRACEHHKGIEKVTEINGVEIFDVRCVFPFRRRVTRLIRNMKGVDDGGTE